MKFVGDPSGRAVERLAHAADRAAARHRSFPLILAGVGAFPNFRRARVVWVGVESDPRLELLHHDLELACAEEGFEVEGRAFRPHVTIARVRDPLPIERARPFARAARTIAFSGAQDVRSLTLFDSTATAGAGYRRVHAAPLGGC
jgi:2'-5' RNA ligase